MLHFHGTWQNVICLTPTVDMWFSLCFSLTALYEMSWKEHHPKWTINVEIMKDGNYHA